MEEILFIFEKIEYLNGELEGYGIFRKSPILPVGSSIQFSSPYEWVDPITAIIKNYKLTEDDQLVCYLSGIVQTGSYIEETIDNLKEIGCTFTEIL